jgi:predicted DNA-binding protein
VSVAKKQVKKIAAKDADQYMLRLPPGLRDKVARRAAENGRSMNTEIIDAIEKHLEGTDRISQLWELFEKHRENIEALPIVLATVGNIEIFLGRSGDGDSPAALLNTWRQNKERAARLAALPPITAEQAAHIRALIKETDAPEDKLLKLLNVSNIEEIKEYERVVYLLEQRMHDQKNPPA